ncbi:MAG: sensor domain-containing protein [Streptosporangiaceae bacterium]|jgi:signal transduction histidine kinase
MEDELRRVAGIIVGAPLTRWARRNLLYCGISGLTGLLGFWIMVVLLAFGLTISASVLGTVVGLLLITVTLRLSRRVSSLHRRLLRRVLSDQVEAPSKFQPGTGLLGRLDRRLRDRVAWRGVWYSLIKLPVAFVQLYAITLTVFGVIDLSYPVIWPLFNGPGIGSGRPLTVLQPLPFGGTPHVSSWPATPFAAVIGAAFVVTGVWLARGINLGDRSLIRGLLGPRTMAERVSELERTRTLAVEDAAAALRRVERDLHDGAQMRLAALAMNLGMAREKLEDPDSETVKELIDAAHRNAVDALADLRDLARGIHPPVLDNGLASALASLATSSAIPASVTADIATRPEPAIETIAYFCAAELIANATKHSYANEIKIKIHNERDGVLRLEVSDDGIGGADASRGSGLAGLSQRVSTVDGRLEVSSPGGGPTTVTVELPLHA